MGHPSEVGPKPPRDIPFPSVADHPQMRSTVESARTPTPPPEAPPHTPTTPPCRPPSAPPARRPLGRGGKRARGADCAVGSGEWAEPPHSPWTLRRRGSKMAIFGHFFGPPRILFWGPEWPSPPPKGGSDASLEAGRGGREGGPLKANPRSRGAGTPQLPWGSGRRSRRLLRSRTLSRVRIASPAGVRGLSLEPRLLAQERSSAPHCHDEGSQARVAWGRA